jgi:hypothetical protein
MKSTEIYEAQSDVRWGVEVFAKGDEVTGDALIALLAYGTRFVALKTPTPKASGPTPKEA